MLICTQLFAESNSSVLESFNKKAPNHSLLLGVWKSHGLRVPIELKILSLDDKSVSGTLKLEKKDLKFHESLWVSKIPQEYTYKFIYDIRNSKQEGGRYTFFLILDNKNMMRGIYTNLKGKNQYFTLHR